MGNSVWLRLNIEVYASFHERVDHMLRSFRGRKTRSDRQRDAALIEAANGQAAFAEMRRWWGGKRKKAKG